MNIIFVHLCASSFSKVFIIGKNYFYIEKNLLKEYLISHVFYRRVGMRVEEGKRGFFCFFLT